MTNFYRDLQKGKSPGDVSDYIFNQGVLLFPYRRSSLRALKYYSTKSDGRRIN